MTDIWATDFDQAFRSDRTSINAKLMPKTVGILQDRGFIRRGMVILDLGAGRFDNVIAWGAAEGVKVYPFDPFNRTKSENLRTVEAVRGGQADLVMVSNVLNVIKERKNRQRVLLQARDALSSDGVFVAQIYEGNKTGVGEITQGGKSWQENRRTADYLREVEAVFPDASVKYGLIFSGGAV